MSILVALSRVVWNIRDWYQGELLEDMPVVQVNRIKTCSSDGESTVWRLH